MLGLPDLEKLAREFQRVHELTDETAKLVKQVEKLNGLIERLIDVMDTTPKKKKRKT